MQFVSLIVSPSVSLIIDLARNLSHSLHEPVLSLQSISSIHQQPSSSSSDALCAHSFCARVRTTPNRRSSFIHEKFSRTTSLTTRETNGEEKKTTTPFHSFGLAVHSQNFIHRFFFVSRHLCCLFALWFLGNGLKHCPRCW